MKRLFLIVGAFFATSAIELHAQDIIVLRDGSLIQSKVCEVLPAEIKYRKFSNPTGPLYTIEKSTVLAINYENGEKESYADYTAPAPQKPEAASAPTGPQKIEVPIAANNAELIAKYNEPLNYKPKKKPSTKPAKYVCCKCGITKKSVLSNNDIEVSIDLGRIAYCCQYKINVKNKTDKTIYVDLGNTFRIKDEKSHIYFDNSEQTTVTHGNASGGSIGLGSVTNALGIGGVVGTLAGGVTVGGGNSNSASTTYTNQRILVIPPHSRKALSEHKNVVVKHASLFSSADLKAISHGEDFSGVFSHLRQGVVKKNDITEFNETSSPDKWKYIITYSTQENFQTYSTLSFEVFLQQILGSSELYNALYTNSGYNQFFNKYGFRKSYLIIGHESLY